MSENKMHTLDEVAEDAQVTKRSLYTYIKTGRLKAVKIGKSWRVSKKDLEVFLASGTGIK